MSRIIPERRFPILSLTVEDLDDNWWSFRATSHVSRCLHRRIARAACARLPQSRGVDISRSRAAIRFQPTRMAGAQDRQGLLSLGIETGDRVALWAPNVPEWVVLQFALAKIGAVLVTVNTSLRAAEIEYFLKQSESSTLITVAGFRDVDYVETIYEVVPELRALRSGHLALDQRCLSFAT